MLDGRKLSAEGLGTFAMVFIGCGAASVDAAGAGLGGVGVSLAFGLAVCVMIYATGHISGAHFNPAVTVGFASAGHFPWREVPGYIAVQCLASWLAMIALLGILPTAVTGATTTALPPSAAFGLEAILTFFLMFVIAAVATDGRAVGELAGVAIGGTVVICAMAGGPLTGASMNPARTLGPALALGKTQGLWLYMIAPTVGAVLAAQTYRWLGRTETP